MRCSLFMKPHTAEPFRITYGRSSCSDNHYHVLSLYRMILACAIFSYTHARMNKHTPTQAHINT